ncbi:MAG: hypothetical protein ABWY93_15340 [Mycobacterium sp.]
MGPVRGVGALLWVVGSFEPGSATAMPLPAASIRPALSAQIPAALRAFDQVKV